MIALEKEVLDELLSDERILPRVKVECLLMPYMGLRPVSQITIPAEIPGGPEMGQRIDEAVKPHMERLQVITEIRAKVAAINDVRKRMERLFEEVVEGSEPFKAYYSWSDRLGLKSEQAKVRPTVHEIFVFKDGQQRKELRKLFKDREKLRAKTQRRPDPKIERIRFAYPEEFNAHWITRMRKLLGHPDCCVRQYALDRVRGVNVEARAAKQLQDALQEGKRVDTRSYPLGYFYPCKPECPNATKKGEAWHQQLAALDERLGAMYVEMLQVNTHMVLKQPEIIARYVSQFQRPQEEKGGADG